jgi:phage tail-like protein
MPPGVRKDPYTALGFLVEIEGLVAGGFSEVSGLQAEVDVFDYREGGENTFVHKLPSGVRYPGSLVLKHGLAESDVLWKWHEQVSRGTIRRRNGSIVVLDSKGSEIRRWNFKGAYPVRWTGPDLNALSGAVAVESIDLAHRGLVRG